MDDNKYFGRSPRMPSLSNFLLVHNKCDGQIYSKCTGYIYAPQRMNHFHFSAPDLMEIHKSWAAKYSIIFTSESLSFTRLFFSIFDQECGPSIWGNDSLIWHSRPHYAPATLGFRCIVLQMSALRFLLSALGFFCALTLSKFSNRWNARSKSMGAGIYHTNCPLSCQRVALWYWKTKLLNKRTKYVLYPLSGAGQVVYSGFFKVFLSETATCWGWKPCWMSRKYINGTKQESCVP